MKQLQKLFIACLAVVMFASILLMSAHAWAVADTFNGILFRPSTGRNDFVMLQDTRTLYQYQFAVAATQVYSYQPLSLRTPAGDRLQGVIDSALASYGSIAFGVLDRLQIGASLPYFFINKFQDPNIVPGTGTKNQMSLGDVKAELKLRVLDVPKTRFGLALMPYATFPTGKHEFFIADEKWNAGALLGFDAQVTSRIATTLNLGYQYGQQVRLRNINYRHRFLMGGGVKANIAKRVVLFAEADSSGAFNDIFTSSDQNQLDIVGGATFDVGKSGVQLKLAGGSCAVCGVGASKGTAVLGINYRYNNERYTLKDDEYRMAIISLTNKALTAESYYSLRDKCPADTKDYQEGKDDSACPKYYELRDVAELYFRCPKPEEYDPKIDSNECQKVFDLSENYTSKELMNIVTLAVSQAGQNCPENPESYNPQVHDPSCPKYYDMLSAVASAEHCPADAKDYQEGKDDSACPKYYELRDSISDVEWAQVVLMAKQDRDHDSIEDIQDRCPDQPEDINQFADSDGCPDGGKSAVVSGEIQTLNPVYFAFNSSKLKADAEAPLNQVIELINQNRWIRQVRIGGHADSIGTAEANYKVSELRAKAVITYMREHGVRADVDLVPIPYGALRPALPNTTEENRAKNRRVVFMVVKPIDEMYPKLKVNK